MSSTYQYKFIQISVSNAQPGANVQVNLAPADSGNISWSSGDPSNQQAGIRLNSLSGLLPLSNASITNNVLTFQTSASGGGSGALQFELDAFLAATGVQYFNLWTVSDPSIIVKACFDNGSWVTVNGSPSPVKWGK